MSLGPDWDSTMPVSLGPDWDSTMPVCLWAQIGTAPCLCVSGPRLGQHHACVSLGPDWDSTMPVSLSPDWDSTMPVCLWAQIGTAPCLCVSGSSVSLVTGMTRLGKRPKGESKVGIQICCSPDQHLITRPLRQ